MEGAPVSAGPGAEDEVLLLRPGDGLQQTLEAPLSRLGVPRPPDPGQSGRLAPAVQPRRLLLRLQHRQGQPYGSRVRPGARVRPGHRAARAALALAPKAPRPARARGAWPRVAGGGREGSIPMAWD